MISVWVNHAAGDPLLMCTILHHSAVHLDTVYQRPPTRLTHVYGMEAARMMNMRLASEDLNPKDTTIAAVIMMLANQAWLLLTSYPRSLNSNGVLIDICLRSRGYTNVPRCLGKNGQNERWNIHIRHGRSPTDDHNIVLRPIHHYQRNSF